MVDKSFLNNSELFSKHLHLLYNMIHTPTDWSLFLNTLVNDLNCQSSLFSIENTETEKTPVTNFVGFDMNDINYYFQHIMEHDIWINSSVLRDHKGFLPSEKAVSYKVFRNSFFFAEFCEARDIHFASGCYIRGGRHSKCLLTFQRNFLQGSFAKEDITYLNLLYPHIKNALTLHEKFDILEQEVADSSTLMLINKLPWPIFIVDKELKILNFNKLAESLLEQHQDFREKRQKLIFTPATLTLEAYVQQLSEQIFTFSASYQGLLLKGKSNTYELFFSPLNIEARPYSHNKQFILFINIHGTNNIDFTQKLKSLYCLTNAEAMVMNGLINGYTLEEIALKKGLKYSTIKSYLGTIFKKTDTNKQHELVSKFVKNYITDFI